MLHIPAEEPIAPIEHRHKVYSALIELLPLLPAHRADLLRRGLSDAVIERNGYRSLPVRPENRWKVCERLVQARDLSGVPGFYVNKAGKWDMVSAPGYIIPVRDPKGRIQGMQVRLDNPKNGHKYVWFSSRAPERMRRKGVGTCGRASGNAARKEGVDNRRSTLAKGGTGRAGNGPSRLK